MKRQAVLPRVIREGRVTMLRDGVWAEVSAEEFYAGVYEDFDENTRKAIAHMEHQKKIIKESIVLGRFFGVADSAEYKYKKKETNG